MSFPPNKPGEFGTTDIMHTNCANYIADSYFLFFPICRTARTFNLIKKLQKMSLTLMKLEHAM